MNAPTIIARNEEQRLDLVTRWPGRVEQGAVILCQPDENLVFLGDGRVLNVVSSGRFVADAGPLPFLAPFLDPATRSVAVTLYFVTVEKPFELTWVTPVEARGEAGVEVVASVKARVFEPLQLVAAAMQLGLGAGSAELLRAFSDALAEGAAPDLGPSVRAIAADEVARIAASPAVTAVTRERAAALAAQWGVALDETLTLTVRRARGSQPAGPAPVAPPERAGRVVVNVPAAEGDAVGWFHQAGVPLLLLDADALARWTGGRPGDRWVLRRRARVAVEPWPDADAVFDDAGEALRAYERSRAHLRERLPGAVLRDARAETTLLDAERAHAETFAQGDSEVAWISVDRSTEALLLATSTEMAAALSVDGRRAVSFRPVGDDGSLAISPGGASGADAVALYALPEPGDDPVEPLYTGRWRQHGEPLVVDLPSGVGVLLWATVPGEAVRHALGDDDLRASIERVLDGNAFAPLPTRWDAVAGGPVAMAFRARPGRWEAKLYTSGSGAVASRCLALHHVEAGEWVPGTAPTASTKLTDRFMEGGDDDPVLLPGERYARLSEIVSLMRRAKKGPRKEFLEAEGIDGAALGDILGRFARALAAHPEHTRAFSRAMRNG